MGGGILRIMEVALNTYSIRNEWFLIDGLNGLLKLLKQTGLKKVEMFDAHFKVTKQGWNMDAKLQLPELADVQKALKELDVKVFALAPHVKYLCDDDKVAETIDKGKMWVDICAEHGVETYRASIGGSDNFPRLFPPMDDFDEEDWEDYDELVDAAVDRCFETFDPVVKYAETKNVVVSIETHHSYSSNYRFMRKLLDKIPSRNLMIDYDVGNYEQDVLRYKMLEECGERVYYWHLKTYGYDKNGMAVDFQTDKKWKVVNDQGLLEGGTEIIDIIELAKLSHSKGFDGCLSIEFEGRYCGLVGTLQSIEIGKAAIAAVNGEAYTIKTEMPHEEDIMDEYMPEI